MTRDLILFSIAAGLCHDAALAKKNAPPVGYEPSAPLPVILPPAPDGAIFSASAGYAPLHGGFRARIVGDMLTISLVENVSTSKSATSKTQRSGSLGVTPPASGPLSILKPEALKAAAQSSSNGQGNASQQSSLSGQISVTIAEVRPNGTALVKGQKVLNLSNGSEWIQISGIVRLSDIGHDNRITSSQVADARITYSGKGSVQNAGREGWLSRFFNKISPF